MPSVQSPCHPNTPSSTSYSPFDHVRRSRTRSTSHFEGRPQSPALSTASGVTSSSHTLDISTSAEPGNIPASLPIVREKHKKHRLNDFARKKICIYHLSHPHARQEDIGAKFGVERSTVSKVLKEKDRWLNISEEDERDQSAKHRYPEFPPTHLQYLTFYFFFCKGLQNFQKLKKQCVSPSKSGRMTASVLRTSLSVNARFQSLNLST